jgi:hypothetical protein
MQIFNAVQMSASQFNNPDSLMGYGIPDFCLANLILSQTSPEDFSGDQLISLYPNPFLEYFEFTFCTLSSPVIIIQVFDMTGRKIMEQKSPVMKNYQNHFSVHHLKESPAGIYILKIIAAEKSFIRKVVKQ